MSVAPSQPAPMLTALYSVYGSGRVRQEATRDHQNEEAQLITVFLCISANEERNAEGARLR